MDLDYSVPHFLYFHNFIMIKICHLGFSFSGFILCGPSSSFPFCTDTCLLPGLSDKRLTDAVWKFEDEVNELYGFERYSGSSSLRARSISQNPILSSNIYNPDQLPCMRPRGDVGQPANLHEAPENHVGGEGGRRHSLLCSCLFCNFVSFHFTLFLNLIPS